MKVDDAKLQRAKDGAHWRTKSGKLVRQRGDFVVTLEGVFKVRCYHTTTAGFHGLLRLDRLEKP